MTTRYGVAPAVLVLAAAAALPVGISAQTVEGGPTNCCTEVYWVGWELGRLQSIASYPTAAYRQDASLHMQRLSSTVQAANETCCRFCEAWSEWRQIQDRILATARELLDSPESDAVETRRAFREWVERQPADLIGGLNRCDLEDGMPCKWLGLVECAHAYFQLGVHLGHATHVPTGSEAAPVPVQGARQDGLKSLEKAAVLIATLRAGDAAPDAAGKVYCDYLWNSEIGVERLLSETVRQGDSYSDAQLAATAAKANRLILDLLVHGRPDLGVSPCPIGGEHAHAECEREQKAGP